MKLVVENLTGRLVHVEIDRNATVAELKREIAKQEQQAPEYRLILLASSGHLVREDQLALADYGFEEGSLIYVFFTLEEEGFFPSNAPTAADVKERFE